MNNPLGPIWVVAEILLGGKTKRIIIEHDRSQPKLISLRSQKPITAVMLYKPPLNFNPVSRGTTSDRD